jgi:addiction module HigA family antidote
MTVGERVQAAIDRLELTQSEAADRMDCSRNQLNNIVRGRSGITPRMALKLQAVLKLDAKRLLTEQLEQRYASAKAKEQRYRRRRG